MVSSDDQEVLAVARGEGVEALERPAELSQDVSPTEPVVQHVLRRMKEQHFVPQVVALLQPTSPLRTAEHLARALDLYYRSEATALISVQRPKHSPYKAFVTNPDGYLRGLVSEQAPFMPRQALPEVYMPNGAIYLVDRAHFEQRASLVTDKTVPFFMSSECSIDIDDSHDLRRAEQFLSEKP